MSWIREQKWPNQMPFSCLICSSYLQKCNVIACFQSCCCCWITSVMSDSVRPHRWQPTRLPCSWDSPGKNTGVGCHFLLQCMKVKSESEVAQSYLTLRDPMDCSLPGSSVHGIFQGEGSHLTIFPDQRKKLSFTSGSNLVSFYWHEWH